MRNQKRNGEMTEPELVNAVGGGDMRRELDLQALHETIDGQEVRYDPEYWPGLYIRFDNESPTVLVFRTGKYNITGAKSIDELCATNREFLTRVRDLGVNVEGKSCFEVRNLVFLDRYDKELNLDQAAIGLGLESTEYEPEQFSGLLFRPPDATGTFLIFRNGKAILTGAGRPDVAVEAFNGLFDKLDGLFE